MKHADYGDCDTIEDTLSECASDYESVPRTQRSAKAFCLKDERKKCRKRQQLLFTCTDDLPRLVVSCDGLQCPSIFAIEYALYLLCARPRTAHKTPGSAINPQHMENFSEAAVAMMVRLGISLRVDWDAIFCSTSSLELLLVVYYWKLGLYDEQSQLAKLGYLPTPENALVQEKLKTIKHEAFIVNAPVLTEAMIASEGCDRCCYSFFNSYYRMAQCRVTMSLQSVNLSE